MIEEQVNDALDDFEAMVAKGTSIDEAVRAAAQDNSLRPEVVRARAQRKFGELTTLSSRLAATAAASRRAAHIKHAIFRYNEINFGTEKRTEYIEIEDWLERELSLQLTEPEKEIARDAMQQAFHRSVLRDLDGLLREAGISVDAQNH